ncbi:MAG: hypothetical protein HYZ53_11170 [Planctomycetes bacterium]|nr:hypothetical protein [Planctomycetota bacterium]
MNTLCGKPDPDTREGPRVLLVGFDSRVVSAVTDALALLGVDLRAVTTVDECTARIADERPAAIVQECGSPSSPCWTAVRLLRMAPEAAEVPLLLASFADEYERALALGARDHLITPLSAASLANALEGSGILLCRVEQCRVLFVADEGAEPDRIETSLRHARCHVERTCGVSPGRLADHAMVPDLLLVDLAGRWANSSRGRDVLEGVRDRPGVPTLTIAGGAEGTTDPSWIDRAFHLPRGSALEVAGLLHGVFRALRRGGGLAEWRDSETGLPTRRAFLSFLRGLLTRAEHEHRRVVTASVTLPREAFAPDGAWVRHVAARFGPGEYLARTGPETLTLVRYGGGNPPPGVVEARLVEFVQAEACVPPVPLGTLVFPRELVRPVACEATGREAAMRA